MQTGQHARTLLVGNPYQSNSYVYPRMPEVRYDCGAMVLTHGQMLGKYLKELGANQSEFVAVAGVRLNLVNAHINGHIKYAEEPTRVKWIAGLNVIARQKDLDRVFCESDFSIAARTVPDSDIIAEKTADKVVASISDLVDNLGRPNTAVATGSDPSRAQHDVPDPFRSEEEKEADISAHPGLFEIPTDQAAYGRYIQSRMRELRRLRIELERLGAALARGQVTIHRVERRRRASTFRPDGERRSGGNSGGTS